MLSKVTMKTLPESFRPFDARMLSVGDGHWIYVEEVGTKGGRPIVFLHGGPGSGSQALHRTLFDPARDHVFLIDQRGAGRSHPYLSCKANTTADLIADLEMVREHFAIAKWMLVGGSWGSTLAIAYAERHPERVSSLVLRALFLGTDEEVRWAFVDGPRIFRPEMFEAFCNHLPPDERKDPLAAYVKRLTDPDRAIQAPSAHVWFAYERALSELAPKNTALPDNVPSDARLPPTSIIEAHYIKNSFFLEPGELLSNAHRLAGIPGTIIQGRYDLLCPPKNAYALAAAWPGARLEIIDHAGHSMTEPGVMDAMRRAIND
ncbi:prolyl aminopeptidase [Hyphomicrobium facile]|uniref:Proline iminopeptidase n=1 Tax=Hyphomicrobium facile TaxID=51670 RepID=A0A1I7MY09_9HYPH|nr:prolyl aminopeptidase [Hyphomicrobium facile]SFV27274.1 proline iminopeptidase [Hyphomicrobium facile]